jgi:hypothetical protein
MPSHTTGSPHKKSQRQLTFSSLHIEKASSPVAERSSHSPGNILLSQEFSLQVSSALEVLTAVFGMGTRVSPPPSSPDPLLAYTSQGTSRTFETRCDYSLLHFSNCSGEALDLFVSVSSTYHYASTPDRSTLSSSRGLTPLLDGIRYLEGGFALRCFQRLSLPDLATQLCSWRNNWDTSGQFIPVLSY